MRLWAPFLLAFGLIAAALPAAAAECVRHEPRLEFCGDMKAWQQRVSSNANVALALARGVTFRANFIFGDAGSKYGDSAESIHEFQREVYARFTGVPLESLVIQVEEPVTVDGYEGIRRAFPITLHGTPFVVALTVIVQPEQNLQILTLDTGTRFIDTHRALHDTLLSQTKLHWDIEG